MRLLRAESSVESWNVPSVLNTKGRALLFALLRSPPEVIDTYTAAVPHAHGTMAPLLTTRTKVLTAHDPFENGPIMPDAKSFIFNRDLWVWNGKNTFKWREPPRRCTDLVDAISPDLLLFPFPLQLLMGFLFSLSHGSRQSIMQHNTCKWMKHFKKWNCDQVFSSLSNSSLITPLSFICLSFLTST